PTCSRLRAAVPHPRGTSPSTWGAGASFALQRRRARKLGTRNGQTGAVTHVQYFGSALQCTPHFHALVPDGVWVPLDDGVRFVELPPPSQAEVERLLEVLRHRVLRMLEK